MACIMQMSFESEDDIGDTVSGDLSNAQATPFAYMIFIRTSF